MHQSHWNKNLIQLRQYRRGDALKSIEGLGDQAAKERPEKKYEDTDRKFCFL